MSPDSAILYILYLMLFFLLFVLFFVTSGFMGFLCCCVSFQSLYYPAFKRYTTIGAQCVHVLSMKIKRTLTGLIFNVIDLNQKQVLKHTLLRIMLKIYFLFKIFRFYSYQKSDCSFTEKYKIAMQNENIVTLSKVLLIQWQGICWGISGPNIYLRISIESFNHACIEFLLVQFRTFI